MAHARGASPVRLGSPARAGCRPGWWPLTLRPGGTALTLLLVGLVWAGGSAALTLGNIEVRSTLGEPFAGVVRLEASAGEVIRRECFSPGADFAGIPDVPRIEDVRFRLETRAGESLLRIAGRAPLKEPLAQVILQVRCPGLPNITRAFLVFVNPATIAQLPVEGFTETADRTLKTQGTSNAGKLIPPGSVYIVRPGDTLSGIASRIAGRPSYSVWPLARRILAANPDAFENGRPETMRAGAALRMPLLDSLTAGSGRSVPRNQSAQAAADRGGDASGRDTFLAGQRPRPGTPVILGEPVTAAGSDARTAELRYMVLTSTLSSLSRSRIRQRAANSATESVGAQTPGSAAQATATGTPARPSVQEPPDAGWWRWALIPGALLILVISGAFVFRQRKPAEVEEAPETPWEVDDSEKLGVGMVYDDFEGTFVPNHAAVSGQYPETKVEDPEDAVQTHLMLAPEDDQGIGEKPAAEQPEEETPFPELPASKSADQLVAEGISEPVRPTGAAPSIDVTALEEPEAEPEDDGWVDLDFESTRILEQDYLAEYAASMKRKHKDARTPPESPPEKGSGAADDAEVLLEASDLMDELGLHSGDSDETGRREGLTTSELPAVQLEPEIDEALMNLSTDDNVVAIDAGKNASVEDQGEDDDEKAKKRNTKP